MKTRFLALTAVLTVASCGSAAVVRIEGSEGSWRLTRNGEPYFIRGGGGGGSKALLREIGGNSFRTWGADAAKRDLDEGAKHGLTVTLGFWLGHHRHGFDYLNRQALADAECGVLATVKRVKDHPALLCYTLGNEMELGEPHPAEMWQFINRLAEKVKAIDPNHPVGTVVADIWKEKADQLNAYAGALAVDGACGEKPHTGDSCLKVSYAANDAWAGVLWQDPANDWGDGEGGANLTRAKSLVFWARGETGGETVSFFMGGIGADKPFSDTANRKLENVKLKKRWTRYRLALKGEDLSRIKTGFGFSLGGQGRPLAFYLDDIEYTAD